MEIEKKVITLQKWWKKYTSTSELCTIHKYLHKQLTIEILHDLVGKLKSLMDFCKGKDGSGLSSGCLVDIFLNEFFKHNFDAYEEYYVQESDMKLCKIPISLKKISGKSTIALDWSKNIKTVKKEYFSSHILIINLKEEVWWKKSPKLKDFHKLKYTENIPMGIYLIDRKFCKCFLKLKSNNKTDTLIDQQSLYFMMKRCIQQKLFIEFPKLSDDFQFNILNAFNLK